MYGYTFTRQFGDTPDGTWVTCLDGLTHDQLATGLRLALDKHPEFPPGAAQFRALCLPGVSECWEHNSAAYKITKPERLLGDETEADRLEREAKADKARIKALEIIRGESNE